MNRPRLEAAEVPHEWRMHASYALEDPLLSCLQVVARFHGKRASGDAVVAGLPLEDNRLTPQLCVRAAARMGLSAKTVRRALSEISELVLPVVLLLRGKHACVLVGRSTHDDVTVIFPESGEAARRSAT